MSHLLNVLKLIRSSNLLIISITQVFAYYFLNPSVTFQKMLEADFIVLLSCTFLVAAAGYIINDYMDVMLDLVNKPDKVIVGKKISRRWAMFLHFLMNLTAFIMAYSLSKKVALLVLGCMISLWIYSQLLKKTYLSGNILVAFLTASTLWILLLFNEDVSQTGIWVYSIFAFGTTLIREIIKDTEDLRGDAQFKCKTLPIVLGIRKTKEVLFVMHIILTALTLAYCSFFAVLSNSSQQIYVMFLVYMLVLVVSPMLAMAWLIRVADVKKDFSRLSTLSKIIMLTGILSMVFWRY